MELHHSGIFWSTFTFAGFVTLSLIRLTMKTLVLFLLLSLVVAVAFGNHADEPEEKGFFIFLFTTGTKISLYSAYVIYDMLFI